MLKMIAKSIVALLSFTLLLAQPLLAKEDKPTTWRFNCNFAPEGWVSKGEKLFCERVKTRTEGKLVIEPYFSSSLGFKSTEGTSILKKGLVEMAELCGGALRGEEPMVAFADVPFLWTDQDEALYWFLEKFKPVLNARLSQKWNSEALAVVVFPGNIKLFSKEPVQKLEDWKGLKVRTWGGPVQDGVKAIGAQPMTVDVAELYTALQRGMISASMTSYTSATESHFWEVLKYIDDVVVTCNPWWIAVNSSALSKLSQEVRAIFLDEASILQNWLIAHRHIENTVRLKMLLGGGMKLVPVDPAFYDQVRPLVKPIWQKAAEDSGIEAKKLLEDLLAERDKK